MHDLYLFFYKNKKGERFVIAVSHYHSLFYTIGALGWDEPEFVFGRKKDNDKDWLFIPQKKI